MDFGNSFYQKEFASVVGCEDEKFMKFNAIVGNPPYQENDGGAGASARALYPYFVNIVKACEPRYASLIIPSKWYAGGKGLDGFRKEMLNDSSIKELHDCLHPEEYFPDTNNRGGVCYLLWDKNYDNTVNQVKVVTHDNNDTKSECMRPLKIRDLDIFIRNSKAISILDKVIPDDNTVTMTEIISPRKPFGLEGNFIAGKEFYLSNTKLTDPVKCYGKAKAMGYMERSLVNVHKEWIDAWKVYMPYANNIGTELNDDNQNTFLGEPGSVCTETFLCVGAGMGLTEESAQNLSNYLRTKFARFLLSLAKISQHGTGKTYRFVPVQDFNEEWTDERLYKKYLLTEQEIDYIESSIKEL